MAKKKKTKEQKILAEIHRRHQMTTQHQEYSLSSTKPVASKEDKHSNHSAIKNTPMVATEHYEYLKHDLRKTIIVTAAIIIAQFILHTFIK